MLPQIFVKKFLAQENTYDIVWVYYVCVWQGEVFL